MGPRADAPTPVLRWLGALFGIAGTVLCLLTLWRGWPPVVWWSGCAALGLGLVLLAWRRRGHGPGRRAAWIAVALVVALAIAAVPVLAPVLRPAADVAWSIEGSEEPVAEAELPEADTASVILTVDAERVLRARQAEDGTVLWQHHAPNLDLSADNPARVAGTVVLVGAGALVDPAEEAVALDLATGAELWSVPANDTPLVHNSSVLVLGAEDAGGGSIFRGVDLTTGDVLWTADSTGQGWQSVPAGTSGSVVPFSEWLVTAIGEPTRHQVTEVATGAQHLVGDGTTYASAGIVDGHLVVQDVLVDPDEVTYGSEIPTQVTAYHLPGGEVAWEAELDLSHSEWRTFSDRRTQLTAFDGVLLSGSGTEGALDVLDLRDGELTTFERAEEVPRIRWAHEDTAIASTGPSSLVLDLAGQQVTEVRRDEQAVEGSMTTVGLDGVAVPAWQAAAEGLFGREYSHLVAFELADVTAPEQTDLGVLPEGAVQGSYAGRVVVMEWELLPDAPDEQPGYRYTAMHVLAPFD